MAATVIPFWSGLGKRLLGRKEAAIPSSWQLFQEIFGGRETKSGVNVSAMRALEVSTVLACCRVLAEGVAQVPFRIYQSDGVTRKVASDHPLNRLISSRPNKWQSSFEFRESLMFHTVLCGNAFVFVNRVGSERRIKELLPIEPGRVTMKRKGYETTYVVSAENGGGSQEFASDAIWHIRGPSWNTWSGLDATRMARESIGIAIALEESQAAYKGNAAEMSGILSVEGTVSPERFEKLAAWIDRHLPGGDRFMKPLVIDNNAKYDPKIMSAVDAQHIESRKHQVEEMCRAFRVMPIMIGQADKAATYASAEQMFIAHVMHTLMPWYVRIEQSADANLLTEAEIREGYYSKFTAQALMRGAQAERGEFYAKGLGSGGSKGWFTQNDVRELEELNPIDDPEADKLPQPAAPAVNPPPKKPDDPA